MTVFSEIASGLEFPEGPIAMSDGSVLVVEVLGHRLTRVHPDGATETVAEIPGGPNGAAIGPDGAVYVCNNGGWLNFVEVGGARIMGPPDWSSYIGGRVQRVDLRSGTVTDLYTECSGRPLRSPNDLVMDGHGGFWFTDIGIRDPSTRTADMTGVFYAAADGSTITEVVFPSDGPNGIGLAPDGATLYWAETHRGRIMRRTVASPGELTPSSPFDPSTVLHTSTGVHTFDSLAVDSEGYVCVATLISGGITVVSPDGSSADHYSTDDFATTNICFGGADLRTAYVTLGRGGKLVSTRWPRAGLRLAHQ
jgi:gluconolactonase